MNTDPEALIQCLQNLRERFEQPAVLFPSGDLNLEIVSNARESLADGYLFPFPEKQLVDLILDKNLFYRFANDNGINIPPTFFPSDLAEVEAFAPNLRYPCLIKPSVANIPWRQKGWKILLAHNRSELLVFYEEAVKIQPLLVIQEVIEGPDSALHFSLTYANRQSECLAMFTGRKLRQYVPHYGISSLAESRWYPEVDQMTRDILRKMGYSGYASIEFKKDLRNGKFYVMEVTGRTWYPHALSEICGVNLPWLAWASLTGEEPLPQMPSQREGVKWMDEINDLRSAWKHYRDGELTVLEWLDSYRGELHFGHYRRGDTAPFYAMLRTCLLSIMKEVLRPVYRLIKRAIGAFATR